MKIAISGHRELDDTTTHLIDTGIRAHLRNHSGDELVRVSCLADGADQIFASAVLDAGGQLVAIVPSEHYRDGLPEASHAAYDALFVRAVEVHRMPFTDSTSEAHMAASRLMLELAEELVAVWDGQPARGYGGTADVVDLAHQDGIDVTVIWPDGATR